MKCPTCHGRGKYSRPCTLAHTDVHDCYAAGCLLPRACMTCAGEGRVVTDAQLEAEAQQFLQRWARKAQPK